MTSSRSPLHDLAQQIADDGTDLGAGRVTFHSSAGYSFAAPRVDEVLTLLMRLGSSKYKHQARDASGRWIDLSTYVPVRVGNELFAAMRALDLAALRRAEPGELRAAALRDERLFRGAIRTVSSAITLQPVRRDLVAWRDYFAEHGASIRDTHLAYLRATIDLLIIALDNGLVSPHTGDDNASALQAIEDHAPEFADGPARVAFEVLRGKLWSLRDRVRAARAFADAQANDVEGLIQAFYIDMGALTYFLPEEVHSQLTEGRAAEVRASIEPLRTTPTRNPLAMLVSVDPNFFRIYGPQMFHLAQQLPAVDVVFLLCCSEEEAQELVDEADRYLAQLVSLNRSGEPRNIQYYRAPVPAFVRDAKTFYASARFFAPQQLLKRYERLYAMDIDLVAEDDPTPYFQRIASVRFGTSSNHNVAAVSPWRRNMAGNVAITRAVLDSGVLADLQEYLTHGLDRESAWMLDQNALTYAIERNGTDYTALDQYNRPFSQPRFRSVWERRYYAEQKRRR